MSLRQPSREAFDWLQSANEAENLIHQAKQLAILQHQLDTWTSSKQLSLVVGPLNLGRLTLFASHPAVVARARQYTPSLQAYLASHGWHIERIDIKVHRSTIRPKAAEYPHEAKLGPIAREALSSLPEQLAPGPLQEAVNRLLARRGW